MAKTIPDLTAAGAAVLTDLIEVSQSSVSKKETLQQVLDLYKTTDAFLQPSNNLSDVDTPSTACTNLGALQSANNLSDVASATTACTNIGALKATNNLSDVASLATTQDNLQITGLQTIYIPASAMYAAITNPASLVQTETTTNKNQTRAYSFSDSATNNVGFRVSMPKRWDGSAIGFRVFWKTSGTSGNVLWQIKAVIRNDSSAEDLAFGTTTSTADNAQASANATSITTVAATVTPAGTAAANAEVEFVLFRDPANGSDTLNAAAIVTGALLFYEANRGNDDYI